MILVMSKIVRRSSPYFILMMLLCQFTIVVQGQITGIDTIVILDLPEGVYHNTQISVDGQFVVSRGDRFDDAIVDGVYMIRDATTSIYVWDLGNWSSMDNQILPPDFSQSLDLPYNPQTGFDGGVFTIAPQGALLAFTIEDDTVLYRLPDLEWVNRLENFAGQLVWSSDGNKLLSLDENIAQVFDLLTDERYMQSLSQISQATPLSSDTGWLFDNRIGDDNTPFVHCTILLMQCTAYELENSIRTTVISSDNGRTLLTNQQIGPGSQDVIPHIWAWSDEMESYTIVDTLENDEGFCPSRVSTNGRYLWSRCGSLIWDVLSNSYTDFEQYLENPHWLNLMLVDLQGLSDPQLSIWSEDGVILGQLSFSEIESLNWESRYEAQINRTGVEIDTGNIVTVPTENFILVDMNITAIVVHVNCDICNVDR